MKTFDIEIWEDFLLKLRYQKSRLIKTTTYSAILLDNPNTAWLVYTGIADVFSVELSDRQPIGTRQHIFTADTGSLLLGADLAHQSRGMVVMQAPHTQLLQFSRNALSELDDEAFQRIGAALLDDWLHQITDIVLPKLAPKEFIPLHDELHELLTDEQTTLLVRTLDMVRWVHQEQGKSVWGADPPIVFEAGHLPFPLTRYAWLTLKPDSRITVTDTVMLMNSGEVWEALDHFQNHIIQSLTYHAAAQVTRDQRQLVQQAESDALRFDVALRHLADTLDRTLEQTPYVTTSENALLAACEWVGEALGIVIEPPPRLAGVVTLRGISQASGFKTREVALAGDWWRQDQGALLAYTESERNPVALLPTSTSSYKLRDPLTGETIPVTETVAASLYGFGVQFYRPLTDQNLTPWGLFKFAFFSAAQDVRAIVLTGIVLGILNLSIPVGTGLLFETVIPIGNQSTVFGITMVLIAATFAMFVVQVAQRLAILRIESRAEMNIISSLWDRLLSQKPAFFRQFSSGDLGARFLGVSQMRMLLGELVSSSLLSIFILIFNMLLMCILSPVLAVLGLVLMGFPFLLMTWWTVSGLGYQSDLNRVAGHNTGLVLQFINGIRKFRVSGAEKRIFAFWAEQFSEQRQLTFNLRRLQNRVLLLGAAYPLLATIPIYIFGRHTSIGIFSAFYVAFIQFLQAGLTLGGMMIITSAVIAFYQRARPILDSEPEQLKGLMHPGELHGEIEVSHVSFRYDEGQSLVLDDVSFSVKRGEFVALVGASGSGKSTLLRLLLGFETPENGAIYYDQFDLKELDVLVLRQQLGVVMQNAKLLAGADLFKNIVGISQDLTLHDAWDAAERVGLANDIRQMPMEMQTLVTEGGGTLSGGQQQRLLIASAIVNKPRIIFFDEATSALDNRTQKVVSESLQQLDATRVVIAHRLSTIIHADKIIVLKGGSIVEMGTYETLIKAGGLFAEMAKRQMA